MAENGSTDRTAALLTERGKVHGDFSEVSRVDQALKAVARKSPNWLMLTDGQRCAVEMILHKAARILCGDPDHEDHWDDVGGYARLGRESRGQFKSSTQSTGVGALADVRLSQGPGPVGAGPRHAVPAYDWPREDDR